MTPQRNEYQRNEYSEMAGIIQAAISPLMTELQTLKGKMDALPSLFVTRQEYTPRHDDLEERIKDLKLEFAEFKKSIEEKQHNAFSSGVAILVAAGSAIVTIVLHFWK